MRHQLAWTAVICCVVGVATERNSTLPWSAVTASFTGVARSRVMRANERDYVTSVIDVMGCRNCSAKLRVGQHLVPLYMYIRP